MQKVLIRQIYKEPEKFLAGHYSAKAEKISVSGWVRTGRSSPNVGFIELNDGTFLKNLQVVYEDNLNNFEELTKISVGSAITAEGELIKSPAAGQAFELRADKVEIISLTDEGYPLQKKRHSFEFLRTVAHLRPRTNTFSAVFRLRSVLAFAIHKFFQERGFIHLHSPIITGSDCEGAGEMFNVTMFDINKPPKDEKGEIDYSQDFFGKKTNLTVSGQLNGEAFALAFRKIYTFGPTFRAENSNTARHAAEFWMIEPEIAFADLEDNMNLAEEMVKYLINYIRQNCSAEMEFFSRFIDKGLDQRLDNVVKSDFKRLTYTEAIEILKKAKEKFKYPVKWGIDLQTEHERYLTEKEFGKPVFVTDYPAKIKAFYMRSNDDGKTVAAMDLLVPGVGEIIGGSQREERLDILKKKIKDFGLRKEDYEWYFDLRKYGGVKHAGFGLGFERAIMYFTGMANIRDVIPFPRTPKNAEF
ncbi:MAG: asparagine--tRNA ligase [Patescibacteria group bacterium]|nr:asparagine--tRNA ligase [Patescibacteria group bacterium]